MSTPTPPTENPLNAAVQEVNGVKVLSFQAAKVLSDRTIADFGNQLMALLNSSEGAPRIVLSFRGVTFLSSAAIGKLIMVHRKIKERGGELRLCSLSPTTYDVFRVAHLQDLFAIDPDVDSSLSNFS